MPINYDPNVDYSDLIAQEAAKGVNANGALLSQYEQQRNQKIQDQGLGYGQTHIYSNAGNGWGANGNITSGSGGNGVVSGAGGGSGANLSGGYYTARDQSDYINQLYDAALKSAQAALQGQYDQQVAAFDSAAERIPGQYRTARNQSSAQAAVERANMNELLAASGLNTGAAGQARLAMGIAAQNDINDINRQQADALADLELQRTQAMSAYSAAVAEAIANNDMERAQALYQEAQRVDNSYRLNIEDALLQQQYQMNNLNMDATRQQMQLAAAADQREQQLLAAQLAGYSSGGSGGGSGGGGGGGSPTIERVDRVDSNSSTPTTTTLGTDAQLLLSQLQRIPGLTNENRIAMILDYQNSGRISEAEKELLYSYLGY